MRIQVSKDPDVGKEASDCVSGKQGGNPPPLAPRLSGLHEFSFSDTVKSMSMSFWP